MTEAYADSDVIYAYLSGAWVSINADVVGDVVGDGGIDGNGPLDRLARTGTLNFTLNNESGKYSPGLTMQSAGRMLGEDEGRMLTETGGSIILDARLIAVALSGWDEGTFIKYVITYDGVSYVRFYGNVKRLKIDSGTFSLRRVYVTAVDWMDYAAEHPLVNYGIETNQRADQAMATMLSRMPIVPLATSLSPGVNIFLTVFDTIRTKTKMLSEMSKFVFSEMSYGYLRNDRVNGETLVLEGNHDRNGLRTLSTFPLATDEAARLTMEDDGRLLTEDGGFLVMDGDLVQAEFLNTMVDLEVEHGENVINQLTMYAFPRKLDSSPQVLFALNQAILIGSGETIQIKGSYINPDGGAPINGQDMIDPVATTDYQVWTNSDGTGTDITSNLVVDVATYGTEGFTHTVTNGSIYPGYITLYNTRGTGIYANNTIEHVASNSASIAARGYKTQYIDQKYQTSLEQGKLVAGSIVELEKKPRTILKAVNLLGNRSGTFMNAFLNLDIGDLIHVQEDQTGVDGWYFIQGRWYMVPTGGKSKISYGWITREHFSLLYGLSMLSTEFAASSTDGINFGYVPHVVNLTERSMSAWVYVRTNPGLLRYGILSLFSDSAGVYLFAEAGQKFGFYALQHLGVTSYTGTWESGANAFALNTWVHVVVTRDMAAPTGPPIIYVNGAAVALTNTSAANGVMNDETGTNLVIGNINSIGNPYNRPMDGFIKDARIYDRILSAGDVTQLYNGGVLDTSLVTDGLVFQAACMRTKELDSFDGVTLTSDMQLIDNIYGIVGTPHGSPITHSL